MKMFIMLSKTGCNMKTKIQVKERELYIRVWSSYKRGIKESIYIQECTLLGENLHM